MSELPGKLRKYEVNAREWYDSELPFLSEAADALEAKDRLIAELAQALKAIELARTTDHTDDWVRATALSDDALSKAREATK